MGERYEAVVEAGVDVAASADRVWALVGDVRRMPELSPYVVSTRLRAGFDEVAVGAQFTNLNRMAGLDWTTHGEIVRFEPNAEIAFRIEENWVVWSFHLHRLDGGGTRLTHRRDTPDGISALSLGFTDAKLGGQKAFTQAIRDGMRTTLERVKALAEEQRA